jgi:hypothetical protein
MAPISNDLLLAAALTSAVPAALAQPAQDVSRPRTGVATTVTTNAARGSNTTTMYIDGTTGQRLTTDANSTIHVLFSDQSALTIGPNSELVIAKFEFDNQSKNGQILINLSKGFLRVVGGLISKKTSAVVRTATATVGIRGGISEITETSDPAPSTGTQFLFGTEATVTDNNGDTTTITRPGFFVTTNNGGSSGASRVSNTAPPTNQQSTDDVGSFSSTRQSDPGPSNGFGGGGGFGGRGGGGSTGSNPPNFNDLMGSPSFGNQS